MAKHNDRNMVAPFVTLATGEKISFEELDRRNKRDEKVAKHLELQVKIEEAEEKLGIQKRRISEMLHNARMALIETFNKENMGPVCVKLIDKTFKESFGLPTTEEIKEYEDKKMREMMAGEAPPEGMIPAEGETKGQRLQEPGSVASAEEVQQIINEESTPAPNTAE